MFWRNWLVHLPASDIINQVQLKIFTFFQPYPFVSFSPYFALVFLVLTLNINLLTERTSNIAQEGPRLPSTCFSPLQWHLPPLYLTLFRWGYYSSAVSHFGHQNVGNCLDSLNQFIPSDISNPWKYQKTLATFSSRNNLIFHRSQLFLSATFKFY